MIMNKYIKRILLTFATVFIGTGSVLADNNNDLSLVNAMTINATVKFYVSDTEPMASFTPGTEATTIAPGQWLVVKVTPASGYFTYGDLFCVQVVGSTDSAQARTRGIMIPEKLTALNVNVDGTGYYCYQIPAASTIDNGYSAVVFRGSVIEKIDLKGATISTDGKTVTTASRPDGWQAEITLDEVSFIYSASAQGPTISTFKLTKGTQSISTTVADHVGISNNSQTAVSSYKAKLTAVETGCLKNYFEPDFQIVEASMPGITATAYSGIYDGLAYGIKVSAPDGATVYYHEVEENEDAENYDNISWLTTNPTFADVCSKTVKYKVHQSGFGDVTGSATVVIRVREMTASVPDRSVTYTGSEQTGSTAISFSNVVEGQTATISYTPSKGTTAATYDNGSYGEDLKVMSGTADVTSNYRLTSRTAGKLTITDRADGDKYEITVVAKSSCGNVYDGTEKSVSGFESLEFDVEGNLYTVDGLTTSSPRSMNVATLQNTVSGTAVVKDAQGNDVTDQFVVNTTDGTLEIKPAKLNIIVDAKEKVEGDDDPALTYSVKGLMEGDNLSGSLTRDIGEAAGDYAITQGTLKASDNYEVIFTGAILTIKPKKPLQTIYNIYINESDNGEVISTMIKAAAGNHVGLVPRPNKGYSLSSLSVKKTDGGEVALDISSQSSIYFLMPASDVVVTATFEKTEGNQNIFIWDAKYGEVISQVLHADPGQQVNLRALNEEGSELDMAKLAVINNNGERLRINTVQDPNEGTIYYFFMNGESVDIYSSFKGTNNTVNESKPLPTDNQLYLLNNDYLSFLKMSNGAEGVQLAMSLVANILAKFTPEDELKVRLGEDDLNMVLLNLKNSWQIKIDFTGPIKVLAPQLLEGLGNDGIISSGVPYKLLADTDLEMLLQSSIQPVQIKSIIVMAPEDDDPTAINGLKTDDAGVDIYDLRGRKMDPTNLRKGVYIRNGKKIVIR